MNICNTGSEKRYLKLLCRYLSFCEKAACAHLALEDRVYPSQNALTQHYRTLLHSDDNKNIQFVYLRYHLLFKADIVLST